MKAAFSEPRPGRPAQPCRVTLRSLDYDRHKSKRERGKIPQVNGPCRVPKMKFVER